MEVKLKTTDELKHFQQSPEIKPRFSEEEKTKLAKAAKDFESLLTSMMLKSMNQTGGGMFGEDTYGGDYFNSIFEMEMADHISHKKGLGIADILYKKLTGEELSKDLKIKLRPELIPQMNLKLDIDLPSVTPGNSSIKRLNRFEEIIETASNQYGVDKNLIKSVILAESAANEKAISSAKAKGLMQLMDGTAKDMGVKNIWDPKENIMGGTKYLAQMLRQYNGDIKLALAGYNAGPGNVQKYNGVPPFDETKNYITRVVGYMNHFNRM